MKHSSLHIHHPHWIRVHNCARSRRLWGLSESLLFSVESREKEIEDGDAVSFVSPHVF